MREVAFGVYGGVFAGGAAALHGDVGVVVDVAVAGHDKPTAASAVLAVGAESGDHVGGITRRQWTPGRFASRRWRGDGCRCRGSTADGCASVARSRFRVSGRWCR